MRARGAAGAAAAFVGTTGIAIASSRDTESSAARFSRTLWHASLAGFDYKFGASARETRGSAERAAALAATHQRSAERLLHVCQMHGGLYTKFGQFVASMTHILPPQYPAVLSACQDRAPAVSFEEVRNVVERELQQPLERCFAAFDPEPIAAASLAQVHRADTLDGEQVAVKVQYPKLARQVAADLRTMRVLAHLLSCAFEGHSYGWILPEFETSMTAELDFCREAANAQRTAKLFAQKEPRLYIPAVLPRLSSSRVLTMEYIDGAKITDHAGLEERGLPIAELAHLVCSVFSTMIFSHGLVHVDPHPGNLLARRPPRAASGGAGASTDVQLVLLDHGMYRELDPGFRHHYCALWTALLTRDHGKGRAAARGLGVGERDYEALSLLLTFRSSTSRGALGAPISPAERSELRERYGQVAATDVNAFLRRLPRDMLFVMRTWALVRSLNRNLGGTTAQRFLLIAEHAAAGSMPTLPASASWRMRTMMTLRGRWVRFRMSALVRIIDRATRLVVVLSQCRSESANALRRYYAALAVRCAHLPLPWVSETSTMALAAPLHASASSSRSLKVLTGGKLEQKLRLPRELG